MPRKRAVRLLGATLVAAAVPGMRPGRALAAAKRVRRRVRDDIRACPRTRARWHRLHASPGSGGRGLPAVHSPRLGQRVHTSRRLPAFLRRVEESRLLVTAKWNAWTPKPSGTVSGTKTSPAHILNVPKREPAPRLSPQAKRISRKTLNGCTRSRAIVGAWSAVIPGLRRTRRAVLRARQSRTTAGTRPCGHELSGHCEAEDTACAQGCGERRDLLPPHATALNKFLALQAKEIGLAGAIVTAFNRSQGAHVRKQVEWGRSRFERPERTRSSTRRSSSRK